MMAFPGYILGKRVSASAKAGGRPLISRVSLLAVPLELATMFDEYWAVAAFWIGAQRRKCKPIMSERSSIAFCANRRGG